MFEALVDHCFMRINAEDTPRLTPRPWLVAGETLLAVSAFAGAIGLGIGSINFGSGINARLPLASPVFGGIALAAVVGVPMSVGAVAEWRRSKKADSAALVAGALLVGWIVVEVSVIRTFSWLQPTLLAAGLGIAAVGYRGMARLNPPSP